MYSQREREMKKGERERKRWGRESNREKIEMWEMRDDTLRDFEKWDNERNRGNVQIEW